MEINTITAIQEICRVLKKRFPNLTVDETVKLAGDILLAMKLQTGKE